MNNGKPATRTSARTVARNVQNRLGLRRYSRQNLEGLDIPIPGISSPFILQITHSKQKCPWLHTMNNCGQRVTIYLWGNFMDVCEGLVAPWKRQSYSQYVQSSSSRLRDCEREAAAFPYLAVDLDLTTVSFYQAFGYALTPQAFPISNLVFGPVLRHPGKTYYTTLGAVIISGRAGTRGTHLVKMRYFKISIMSVILPEDDAF